MSQKNFSKLIAAASAWDALTNCIGGLSASESKENAHRMMSLLDEFLECEEDQRASPPLGLAGLIQFVTEWITEYEERNVKIPESDPVELLDHLMKENGLRQADLATELGGQPVVSAILRGERKINLRQAVALGKRFALDFSAFISQKDALEADYSQPFESAARTVNITPQVPVRASHQWSIRSNCSVLRFKEISIRSSKSIEESLGCVTQFLIGTHTPHDDVASKLRSKDHEVFKI
jgi:HTH-type transcriptional regulator / antitoxin HigA